MFYPFFLTGAGFLPSTVAYDAFFIWPDVVSVNDELEWYVHLYLRSTPHPVTVTTRIITFLVGNPYKPSFATVTGWGVDPTFTTFLVVKNMVSFLFKWHNHPMIFPNSHADRQGPHARAAPHWYAAVYSDFGKFCWPEWVSQVSQQLAGWWFQTFFIFYPYLGKWSNLITIFQMGWFNHQLAGMEAPKRFLGNVHVRLGEDYPTLNWFNGKVSSKWKEMNIGDIPFSNHDCGREGTCSWRTCVFLDECWKKKQLAEHSWGKKPHWHLRIADHWICANSSRVRGCTVAVQFYRTVFCIVASKKSPGEVFEKFAPWKGYRIIWKAQGSSNYFQACF